MSNIVNRSLPIVTDSLYLLNDNNIINKLFPLLPQVVNTSYRLNTDNTVLDTLEQYVSQITKFHSSRLNLSYYNTTCVEFSIITPLVNQCNIVYDKLKYEKTNIKNCPVYSIITNLNDCTYPLLLTEINQQQYKYKQFTDLSHNNLIFLKKNMYVVFDSSKYHGFVDILNDGNIYTNHSYLLINVWSYPLDNIPYYSSGNDNINCAGNINYTDINDSNSIQVVDASCLKFDFFEQLLYNSRLVLDDEFITHMKKIKTNYTLRIVMQIEKATSSTACRTVSTHITPDTDISNNNNNNNINISTWSIRNHNYHDDLLRTFHKFSSGPVLLDLTKQDYTFIEKYVYDIAMFHFKRLNIYDIENHTIEFCCKSIVQTQTLHVEYDKMLQRTTGKYIYPLLSCITYLNDANCPTIITNIDTDCYKYKEFESQSEFIISLPKRNKQITFDGHFFHGSITLFDNQNIQEQYIIAINFWKTRPLDINFYNPDTEPVCNTADFLNCKNTHFVLDEDVTEICSIYLTEQEINYNFFNDILYNNKNDSYYLFNPSILSNHSKGYHTFKFIKDPLLTAEIYHLQLKDKYGSIVDDIRGIINPNINLNYNRFLQRFLFSKIYSVDICSYIINEYEKYAKLHDKSKNKHQTTLATCISVDKIPSIFGIILETLKTITNKIHISYGLHPDMSIDINDLFVVKYSYDKQNTVEMPNNSSFFLFNILLNDVNQFKDGGTHFADGLTYCLEQGDILIYNSYFKHSKLPVTTGYQYLLVGCGQLLIS